MLLGVGYNGYIVCLGNNDFEKVEISEIAQITETIEISRIVEISEVYLRYLR